MAKNKKKSASGAESAGRGSACPLTDRELEVLRMISQGISTEGIAERFGISANTVRFHVRLILAKLGVNDRAHAVAVAMREGWL